MAIDKEKAIASSPSKGQGASQKNAAISSKDEWESVFIQQGSDAAGEVSTVVPDSRGVPYIRRRVFSLFVRRWDNLSCIFRVQPGNDAMGP